jgi:hypothetical protein
MCRIARSFKERETEQMMLRVLACAVVIVVGACVSTQERVAVLPSSAAGRTPQPTNEASLTAGFRRENLGWARSDGRRISGDADLTAQAHADIGGCQAESPPSGATGTRGEACMRAKGYYVRGLD